MFFGKEKKELLNSIKSAVDSLRSLAEKKTSSIEKAQKRYTDEEKWKAAYALNLCTVSISQIIEYNDIRFMDQEYENILNNLNLEMIPKDEALLEVIKKILDVISFFRIQEKEKELLAKEYQQKMKDAVWSAIPNPAVIMAGGSSGWIGIAVTAALSVGTGYMNYRKEKAKIGLEQERKEWELERSLIEQLHGLRRQLFETSWRLATEYQFSDSLRLTEKQIKMFNEMLLDDDPLRRYYRLEYVQTQFVAYPPFWYYIGAAALKVANDSKNDLDTCSLFLEKANVHFDLFFEKSKLGNKLLREDPVVAQCAFEYIAMLNLKEQVGLLCVDKTAKKVLICEKINTAVESAGNALDALQMCALNYLASGNEKEAVSILRMLVNEFYNVSSNAPLLSMLYVKSAIAGDKEAKVSYDLLTSTCPYRIEFYKMPQDFGQVNFSDLDRDFCSRQKVLLANKYIDAIKSYISFSEAEFNNFWVSEFDITESLINYFEDFAKAMDVLLKGNGGDYIRNCLAKAVSNICEKNSADWFSNYETRSKYTLRIFIEDALLSVMKDILKQIEDALDYSEISRLESILLEFCTKYSLTTHNNELVMNDKTGKKTIESIFTGKGLSELKNERNMYDELVRMVKSQKMNGNIVISDSKEVACFYSDTLQCQEYVSRCHLPTSRGKVIAVIKDKKGIFGKHDLVFTTAGIYVVGRNNSGEYKQMETEIISYADIVVADDSKGLEHQGHKIYKEDHKSINYQLLGELVFNLKQIIDKYNVRSISNSSCQQIIAKAKKQLMPSSLRCTKQ